MKKIAKLYKSYMIRPILYKSVTRSTIALALVLLWGRLIDSPLSAVRDGSVVVAFVLFMMGWFSYLKLDGMRAPHPPKPEDEKKEKPKKRGDIIDFVDEHIVTFDELSDEEQSACILAADVCSGAVFLMASIVCILAGI